MGADTAAGKNRTAIAKPVLQPAIRAVADAPCNVGTEPRSLDAGDGEVSFLRARTPTDELNAQAAKVRLERMEAEVTDGPRATAMRLHQAWRERDAWLKWPPRVTAEPGVNV